LKDICKICIIIISHIHHSAFGHIPSLPSACTTAEGFFYANLCTHKSNFLKCSKKKYAHFVIHVVYKNMTHPCPQCNSHNTTKDGFYKRKNDSRHIQRYHCNQCNAGFSNATNTPAFGHNKRRLNHQVSKFLGSGNSLRMIASLLHTTRTTVKRKLEFASQTSQAQNQKLLQTFFKSHPKAGNEYQFDELETFEHTKYKPISVGVMVHANTRLILATNTSAMAPKGKAAKIAEKLYGTREDKRKPGIQTLLKKSKEYTPSSLTFTTDKCSIYPKAIKKVFSKSTTYIHHTHKSVRSKPHGLGELKDINWDPLFSINHTLASLRARISRLFRKTWNTTKKQECLQQHLHVYTLRHNQKIIRDLEIKEAKLAAAQAMQYLLTVNSS
jgi:transposase-like protein